jgi:hypothetical protein
MPVRRGLSLANSNRGLRPGRIRALEGLAMMRELILEAGVFAGVAAAVVMFGGTEPISFALIEILLFSLGCFALLTLTRGEQIPLPRVVPAILLGLIVVELVPLPRPLLRGLAASSADVSPGPFAPISVIPYETHAELLHWVVYVATFYLTVEVVRRREAMRRMVMALLALGSLEALFGIVQFLTDWQPLRRFITSSRAYPIGTYVNRDHFAGFLELVYPFALAKMFEAGASLRTAGGKLRSVLAGPKLGPLLFWFTLSVLLLLGIVSSLSRMGILSALFSTVLVAALLIAARPERRMASLLTAAIVCTGIVLVLWIGVQPVITRYEEQMTGRLGIWSDTLTLIRKTPVAGVGLGTLGTAIEPVQTVHLDRVIDHAHNDYLEFAVELGIPGAALLFGSIFWLFARTVRRVVRRGHPFPDAFALGAAVSVAALLAHSLTDFNLHIPANAMAFAMVLGIAWRVTHEDQTPRETHDALCCA